MSQTGCLTLRQVRAELLRDYVGIGLHCFHNARIHPIKNGPGLGTHDAVLGQAGHPLYGNDRVFGGRAVDTVNGHRRDVAVKFRDDRQNVLYHLDRLPPVSLPQHTGEGLAAAARVVGLALADKFRQLKVRTNADNPRDTAQAVKFGAEGIGLCRTEHMFFEEDRIPVMREMILAPNVQARRDALNKLLPMQRKDFEGIYKVMNGHPVTIRFLDPPLHEFLPNKEEDILELSKTMGITPERLRATITNLHEFNPMMGHRGCRLSVTYPEIAEMQTRAVIEAAINVRRETGINVIPEIMIPLVGEDKELIYVKKIIDKTAKEVLAENDMDIPYLVGTMIEIPRAALTADELAKEAQFFSFGTNDLSQMTFGFSRDDAGKFLDYYYEKKIYEFDPFARLDVAGVGKLIKMAVQLGRSVRPDIKLGICGEHGGDPSTVDFCHQVGLNYVSCSPFRVPIARLAAAQACIRHKND